jgi:hypothetical protein
VIPDFLENGYLPEGIYEVTLQEVIEKFCFSKKRKKLIEGLKNLINTCLQCQVNILYIDGSFVSQKLQPQDYDACYDTDHPDREVVFAKALESILESDSEMQKRYFGGEIYYAHLKQCFGDFSTVLERFQICKEDGKTKKGIVKIKLLNYDKK